MEEDEGGLGPLGRALLEIAPAWAAAADALTDGDDATAGLLEAVRAVVRQRDLGEPLHFPLMQADLLGGELSPAGRAFLEAFLVVDRKGGTRLAGRERLASLLGRFLDEAGGRAEGADLTGAAPPDAAAIMTAVNREGLADLAALLGDAGLDAETATPADVRAAMGQEAEGAPVEGEPGLFQDGRDRGLGPILAGYEGDYVGAALALEEAGTGEAPGALSHPDVGPIALVWGEEGTDASDGYGLAKLIAWHPEVIADLPARLAAMRVKTRSDNRIRLESADGMAVVSLEFHGEAGAWLLTAFDRGQRRAQKSMDTLRDLMEAAGVTLPARRQPKAGAGPDGAQPQTLEQRTRGRGGRGPGSKGPRGSITFVPGRPGFASIMRLFARADLSTVLHETGHYFFEVLGHVATAPDLAAGAAPVLTGDFATLLEAVGIDPGDRSPAALAAARERIGVEHHERIARPFESYLMEGVARRPSRRPQLS